MTGLVFPSPAPITLPVLGSASRFPVGRVFCIGRNHRWGPVTLARGDLVFTGTPAGDVVSGGVQGIGQFPLRVDGDPAVRSTPSAHPAASQPGTPP